MCSIDPIRKSQTLCVPLRPDRVSLIDFLVHVLIISFLSQDIELKPVYLLMFDGKYLLI